MPNFDENLMKMIVEQILLPHFENPSTLVRKQVVMTLAELKYAMEVRLLT